MKQLALVVLATCDDEYADPTPHAIVVPITPAMLDDLHHCKESAIKGGEENPQMYAVSFNVQHEFFAISCAEFEVLEGLCEGRGNEFVVELPEDFDLNPYHMDLTIDGFAVECDPEGRITYKCWQKWDNVEIRSKESFPLMAICTEISEMVVQ